MVNLASLENGASITAATCFDPEHDPINMLDGSQSTFVMTTGLFPQEYVIKLSKNSRIDSISLTTLKVREVELFACEESGIHPTSWERLGQVEINESEDINTENIRCRDVFNGKAAYIKIRILAGWDDFGTIYTVEVESA